MQMDKMVMADAHGLCIGIEMRQGSVYAQGTP
jgi:hypothetical protein